MRSATIVMVSLFAGAVIGIGGFLLLRGESVTEASVDTVVVGFLSPVEDDPILTTTTLIFGDIFRSICSEAPGGSALSLSQQCDPKGSAIRAIGFYAQAKGVDIDNEEAEALVNQTCAGAAEVGGSLVRWRESNDLSESDILLELTTYVLSRSAQDDLCPTPEGQLAVELLVSQASEAGS